jgi:STE24 endopeptidase
MVDESKRYDSAKRLVTIAGFVADIAILLYLVTSGWSVRIREFTEGVSSSDWIQVGVYTSILVVIFKTIDLPLSFYSGYFIEHRFGLSRQTRIGWLKDELKSIALGLIFALAAVEALYALLRNYPDRWWIYASAAFIVFAVVMANLAPVLLLPLFYTFKPVENSDLHHRVSRLARRTNTNICGIFEWSLAERTRKANAAVVGWGNTRRIIVSDTLLRNFSGEEIEVIMAHELCHNVKNHI